MAGQTEFLQAIQEIRTSWRDKRQSVIYGRNQFLFF